MIIEPLAHAAQLHSWLMPLIITHVIVAIIALILALIGMLEDWNIKIRFLHGILAIYAIACPIIYNAQFESYLNEHNLMVVEFSHNPAANSDKYVISREQFPKILEIKNKHTLADMELLALLNALGKQS